MGLAFTFLELVITFVLSLIPILGVVWMLLLVIGCIFGRHVLLRIHFPMRKIVRCRVWLH